MNTAVSSALSPALDAQAAPATPTPIPTALPAPSLAPAPAAPRRSFALPARLQPLKRLPPTLALAWLVIAVAALWALAPGWFAHQNPIAGQAGQQLLAPGAAHWLGTDALGATCGRAWCMAQCIRCRAPSWPWAWAWPWAR